MLSACVPLAIGQRPYTTGATPPPPPIVSVASTELKQVPTEAAVGLHYCYEHAPIPLMCLPFGERPTAQDLSFVFELTLNIENPSPIPMPVANALVAFTAFPDADVQENLGALCLSLCPEDQPGSMNNCRPQDRACQSTEPEIRGLEDFAAASVNFLIGTALGTQRVEDLRVRTIPPRERIQLTVRLELAYAQMLRLIEASVGGALEGATQGRFPELVIPYRLEGTVWVTVENFGRFAGGFGPVEGSWDLGEVATGTDTFQSAKPQ